MKVQLFFILLLIPLLSEARENSVFSFKNSSLGIKETSAEEEDTVKITFPTKEVNICRKKTEFRYNVANQISNKTPGSTLTVEYELQKINEGDSDCMLYTKSITIKEPKNVNSLIFETVLTIADGTDKSGTSIYKLKATSHGSTDFCIIKISDGNGADDQNTDKNMSIAMGANFDFANGIDAKSLYAKLEFFEPRLLYWGKGFGLGLYCGLYQSKYISSDLSDSLRSFDVISQSNTKISFLDNKINHKQTTTVDFVDLFISFPLCGFQSDKLGIFYSPEFEIKRINQHIDQAYTTTSTTTYKDTSVIFYDNFIKKQNILDKYQKNNDTQYYDKHIGYLNFILTYKDNSKSIFLSSTLLGWHIRRGPYYQYKFDIVENKYKIALGGEFSGIYKTSELYMGIHLSKLFNLSALFKYM